MSDTFKTPIIVASTSEYNKVRLIILNNGKDQKIAYLKSIGIEAGTTKDNEKGCVAIRKVEDERGEGAFILELTQYENGIGALNQELDDLMREGAIQPERLGQVWQEQKDILQQRISDRMFGDRPEQLALLLGLTPNN